MLVILLQDRNIHDNHSDCRRRSEILTKRGGFEVQGSEDVEEVLRMAQAKEVDTPWILS